MSHKGVPKDLGGWSLIQHAEMNAVTVVVLFSLPPKHG